MSDWADEIVDEWADSDGICCVKKQYVLAALGKAKADGVRWAAQYVERDETQRELRVLADKIERGE